MRLPRLVSLATCATALLLMSGMAPHLGATMPGAAVMNERPTTQSTLVRDGFEFGGTSAPNWLAASGDLVYFNTDEKGSSYPTLWRSDGTAKGTFALRAGDPNRNSPQVVTTLGESLLFSVGTQLWLSDGSREGTSHVPGVEVDWYSRPGAVSGGVYVFEDLQSNPWRTDGTAAGTFALLDRGPKAEHGLRVSGFTSSGSAFWWSGFYNGVGSLWTSDGTREGTRQISLPASITDVRGPTPVGGFVYFIAVQPGGASHATWRLWRTDGTEAGTVPLLEQTPTSHENPHIANLTEFNGRLYFTATGASGHESILWRTDGTAAGTVPVGPVGVDPHYFTIIGSRLYFDSATEAAGREVWVSDGTTTGTGMLADLAPGPRDLNPLHFLEHNGLTYFQSWSPDSASTRGVWVTDGTAAGTRRIEGLRTKAGTFPDRLASTGSSLYYLQDSGGRREVRSYGLYELHPTATSAALLRAKAASKVRVRAKVRVPVKLMATSQVRVRVRTTVKLGSAGKKVRLRKAKVRLAPPGSRTVRLLASRSVTSKIRAAVQDYRAAPKSKKSNKAVVARVVIKGTSPTGQGTVIRLKVRLT